MKDTHARPAPDGRRFFISISIIAAVSLAAYSNTLLNGFVYDDHVLVLANPWIRDARFLPDIFSSNTFGFKYVSTNFYRPMMHLFYMLTYHIFGLRPWGFHLINILLHAGNSVLVYLVASVLLSGYKAPSRYLSLPLMSALLFAVHPIHTEAVAWIAGLTDLSYAFFCLLSLCLYLKSRDRYNSKYYLSVTAFFAATLCKEPALTLPVILAAYDLLLNRKNRSLSFFLKRYALFALAAAAYLGIRFYSLGGGMAPAKGSTEYGFIGNLFVIMASYIDKLALPINLRIIYLFRPAAHLFEPRVAASIAIAALSVAVFYIAYKKDRLALFCLLVVAVPLLPCLYVPSISAPSVIGERYLYLPSAGFTMLVSLIFARLAGKRGRIAAASAFSLLAVLFFAGTVYRNADWKDNYSLWSGEVKNSPGSAIAHNNLGGALLGKGMDKEALEEFSLAVGLKPDYAEAHNNLGLAYGKLGRDDLAAGEFLAAIKYDPSIEDVYRKLGIAYSKMGKGDLSIEAFEESLKWNPDNAEAHNGLGVEYAKKGEMNKALENFQAATRLDPANAMFRKNLERAMKEKRG